QHREAGGQTGGGKGWARRALRRPRARDGQENGEEGRQGRGEGSRRSRRPRERRREVMSRRSLCVRGLLLFLALTLSLAGQGAPSQAQGEEERERNQAFREFQERVAAYVKLRKSLEETVPAAKATNQEEKIKERRLLLAQKLMGARKDAKHGDIFTREI